MYSVGFYNVLLQLPIHKPDFKLFIPFNWEAKLLEAFKAWENLKDTYFALLLDYQAYSQMTSTAQKTLPIKLTQ